MKNTIWILSLVMCLLSPACKPGTSPVSQSVLSLADATKERVVFNVALRKGDSICVSFGENGTTMSTTPDGDRSGQLIIDSSGEGVKIAGQFFGHVNPKAKDFKIMESIKEDGGIFQVGTYSQWGVKDIPISVYLRRK